MTDDVGFSNPADGATDGGIRKVRKAAADLAGKGIGSFTFRPGKEMIYGK
jgi:hypothetical protein